MDYYSHQEKTTYLNQPCNITMGGCKYVPDKMRKTGGPCRESSEGFEYPSLFSSRTYSILSYIVGGFVGSKSQMNNNKHNLSYDLSAAIFNILNPCKYDKVSIKKNYENNFYSTAAKINPECYEKYIGNKSSQKSENCSIDVMDFNWLSALPLTDFIQQENYISALNNFPIVKNKTENQTNSNCDENKESISTPCHKEEFRETEVETEIVIESPSEKSEECVSEKQHDNSLNDPSSAEPTVTQATAQCEMSYLSPLPATQRLRLLSECSVESTDSESFIVFDDVSNEDSERKDGKECLNFSYYDIYDEDDDDEDEEEEEDEDDVDDCGSDIYLGDKELVEANSKWAKNYSDVSVQDCETEKKVRFNEDVKINKIVAWDYAYRAARPGPWEQMARDRVRFREKILRMSSILSPVLRKEHRDKIYKKLHS